jgi:hypothetical protein
MIVGVLMTCESVQTAVRSLAAVTSLPADEVDAAVTSVPRRDVDRDDDPVRALPRLVAERLGRQLGGFTEVRYFHGTRTSDPGRFRRDGLLPLGERLDEIWRELREVGADLLSAEQFAALRADIESGAGGDGGWQYRTKAPYELHHGPYGEYVREHFLRHEELSAHDYLRTPEIVEDIAIAADDTYGVDLLAAYTAATRACIVSFDMPVDDEGEARAVRAACWYVWAAAHGEVTRDACGGFDGHGVPVPAAAIREVALVDR